MARIFFHSNWKTEALQAEVAAGCHLRVKMWQRMLRGHDLMDLPILISQCINEIYLV